MWSTRKKAILSVFILSSLYYSLILLFKDNEWVRSLLVLFRPIAAGSFTFFWLNKAYRITTDRQKYFWLLLSISILFYIASNILWVLSVLNPDLTGFSETSFSLWIITYLFFLIALIYKIKLIDARVSTIPYLFAIFIFMTFIVSISLYYFITPLLVVLESFVMATSVLVSFILSLSILFVIIYLYYLSLYSKEKDVIEFIVIGFFFQVLADSIFSYLNILGAYQHGGFVDFLWLFAILMIGVSAKFVKSNAEQDWNIISFFQNRESIFPYIGVFILMILVTESYNWELNTLSAGLIITIIMIILRQKLVMRKNQNLVNEYRHLAYHDSVTGIKNRSAFIKDLTAITKKAGATNRSVSLMLIDLDRFKNINDTHGHSIGDQVLKAVAKKLKKLVSNMGSVYRIGGDEFAIILPDCSNQCCIGTAHTLLAAFKQAFIINHHELSLTPSIGISLFPNDGLTDEILLKHTVAAMYLSKKKGNNFQFYDAELNASIARRIQIETELYKAIKENQLELFYQPKVNLKSGELIGMEALLRWNHPQLGNIPPMEFIPVAEETGQIIAIGEWVLRTACLQNMDWQSRGYPKLAVSVNVSARQFEQDNFLSMVNNTLLDTKHDAQFLELEITESMMQNTYESLQVVKGLKKLGVKTSIDDFGTGYSSLHILKELPIDTIKIDKSFIDHIENAKDLSIIKTIIDISINLNLNVIAEGIETKEQVEALLEHKCNYGQGYLFAKPLPVEAFEHLLNSYLIV